MEDHIIRAISSAGGIRILVCSATELAKTVCSLQQTSLTATVALSRGLAAGAIMGALLKDNQRVALKFEGNGGMRSMIIEADGDGAVRGCVAVPQADAEPVNGKWNVPQILGRAGFLTVTKDIGVGGVPYRGMVQLRSSEIGDDLAYYLTDSEQIPSAVGVTAQLDLNGDVVVCGGFLVQALPGADEGQIDAIMKHIEKLPPISDILKNGTNMLIEDLFGDIPYTVLETRRCFFRCGCSHEKCEKVLLSLGKKGLCEMRDKEGEGHVTCEFCKQTFTFDVGALDSIISRITTEKQK